MQTRPCANKVPVHKQGVELPSENISLKPKYVKIVLSSHSEKEFRKSNFRMSKEFYKHISQFQEAKEVIWRSLIWFICHLKREKTEISGEESIHPHLHFPYVPRELANY